MKHVFKLLFLFLLFSDGVFAKEVSVRLVLDTLKPIVVSELSGDEVYFKVMEYSNSGTFAENRVPNSVECWCSKDLDKLRDVVLWRGTLKEKESVKLILSLVEQDLAPIDADDVFGNVELMLANNKGVLKKEWGVPVLDETQEAEMLEPGDPQHFMFKGSGAKYEAAFSIKQ